MTQRDLDCAVAHATGETLGVIRSRGFSMVDPGNSRFDPEPDQLRPQMIDWDDWERQRAVPVVEQRGAVLPYLL